MTRDELLRELALLEQDLDDRLVSTRIILDELERCVRHLAETSKEIDRMSRVVRTAAWEQCTATRLHRREP